ncbi:ribosome recycling factor family protein [Shewanella sp. JNE10-2]|uniref:ribosome recycling factor family protein n=1 Tax=unclassified Shewanella TaxID=196818 RepID=UPI00200692F9|nr:MULTISPECIES: ribosome recycling factor family protein [unclassified Shewanella]MCK7629070.1 ribosome recycling factor family protein [Shewanella sp. JNE9-1]MCK7633859.1 ribosome recycling factor family protein [Shewanella sp. JNE17]MCK7644470.1 ribosome recycling factor family protein [Shewanella sp. JNE3-1]MCK7649074.1 ribosome recycling factor family protein [Shewanella sp. JNE8]MCK7652373.1 ribosome recycling factor family protein [Shewanella sp. JNE4-1]
MNDDITISLPSLIHRIGREAVKQAQAIATQYDCELKRVRRSRNWCIVGAAIKIQSCTAHLQAEQRLMADGAFRYLIQKLESALLQYADKLEPLDAKLIRLITDNPAITLGELMQLTQCTVTEARLARFQADSSHFK